MSKNKPGRPPSGDSLHHWRTEKEKALAKKHQLEADTLAGELVHMATLRAVLAEKFASMAAIIRSAKIPEEDRDSLLDRLHEILTSKPIAPAKEDAQP
jgi:hypothetical protein